MSRVLWITGLPGSGKSTVALALKERLPDAVVLRMDELRMIVTPVPDYSDAEREYVYRALVFTARILYVLGHDVIIDATGNRKSWRMLARELIPDFIEVYLTCPVEVCMGREKNRTVTHDAPSGIYERGSRGWPVPGMNVPYEKPERPEITIDTQESSPSEAVEHIIQYIERNWT